MSRTAGLCALALVAFAANSLLTRMALRPRLIDPATFVAVRLGAGAVALWILVRARRAASDSRRGSALSALLLFAYAIPFSYAYLEVGAGMGALILFGSVQITMISWGLLRGERPRPREWGGLGIALAGLAALTLPGAERPDLAAFSLMVTAGAAWGAYSLRGRGSTDPLGGTAGNFVLSVPLAGLWLVAATVLPGVPALHAEAPGIALAAASGAIASGVGYALWYAALPGLTSVRAALVQLTVPVLSAAGAVVLLGEQPTARLLSSGAAVLVGVALALRR